MLGKRSTIIVLLFLTLVVTSKCFSGDVAMKPKPPFGKSLPVPTFNVDLDAPAESRWLEPILQFKTEILKSMAFIRSQIPPADRQQILELFSDVDNYLGDPWSSELKGIAKTLNVSVGDLVISNYYYELTSACTSIVAWGSDDTIYHARNLDYGLPGLQKVTANINFVRGDKVLYRGVTYIGYIGLLTGMKPNVMTVSVDERHTNGTVAENVVEAILKKGQSIGFFLRSVLENEKSFESALDRVTTEPLASVSYIIMAGTKNDEGVVVTRDRNKAQNVWRFDPPWQWYLVETNYDHQKPVPKSDNRRGKANELMNEYAPVNITLPAMYDVLSTFPVLNSETTFTTLMSADLDSIQTMTRNNKL